MANAHEGARRVDAHGVLPAVVLPLGTLVDICKWKRKKTGVRLVEERKWKEKEESVFCHFQSRQSAEFRSSTI